MSKSQVLFEIFDFDNDKCFGLEDLITLLRTFESSSIVPQLINERKFSNN